MGSKAAGWLRPRTCGSTKLESISQTGEVVFLFTNRLKKKRVKAEETVGEEKTKYIHKEIKTIQKIYLTCSTKLGWSIDTFYCSNE